LAFIMLSPSCATRCRPGGRDPALEIARSLQPQRGRFFTRVSLCALALLRTVFRTAPATPLSWASRR